MLSLVTPLLIEDIALSGSSDESVFQATAWGNVAPRAPIMPAAAAPARRLPPRPARLAPSIEVAATVVDVQQEGGCLTFDEG